MINFYKDKICLNVLAGSLKNAKDIYSVSKNTALVGVLSINYPDVISAIADMQKYNKELDGNLSVGLGAGNPNQCYMVSKIAKSIKANHFNQVFTAVASTRANLDNESSLINCLVSPTGKPGFVKISTGPISSKAQEPAIVSVDTAAKMCKEMGGSSLKFFPMNGLSCREELVEVAKACANNGIYIEPTGGIDLNNFKEILKICLDAGVDKVIPHVYSSIIDKETNETRISDVIELMKMIDELI